MQPLGCTVVRVMKILALDDAHGNIELSVVTQLVWSPGLSRSGRLWSLTEPDGLDRPRGQCPTRRQRQGHDCQEARDAEDRPEDDAAGVGYLLKERVSDRGRFAEAVRRVAEGGSALDPEVVSQMVGRGRITDPLAAVTPRERKVLELMAEGRSNRAIAETLVISERAVEKHVTSIFAKLNLTPAAEDHRRVLAVLAFLGAPGQ